MTSILKVLTISILLLATSLPSVSLAKPLSVTCKTQVSTFSWYPLRLEVIARLTEGRVLQQLTRGGKMTLMPRASSQPADVKLVINARIIEDAGKFTVFVSATPKNKDRLGSFAAVATKPITRRNKQQIQKQMEQAAIEAGRKLMALIGPRLAQLLGGEVIPIDADAKPPLSWGEGVFRARVNKGALTKLSSVMSRAQKEAGARQQLARCAQAGGRQWTRCVSALAQLTKKHPFAQRAIIAMLVQAPPKDKRQWNDWKKARREAFKISTTFEGPALAEAVQAWLFIFGADRSDYGYHLFPHRREDYFIIDSIARYLLQTRNVPNLDLALARCSRPSKAKKEPPSSACLKVLATISLERRIALVYKYLAKPPRFNTRASSSRWGSILKTVVERNKPLHPMVTKICISTLRRGFHGRHRADCVEALSRGAKPTRALADVLLHSYLNDAKLSLWTGRALETLAKRERRFCDYFAKKLAPYIARRAYPDYQKTYSGKTILPQVITRCRKWQRKNHR